MRSRHRGRPSMLVNRLFLWECCMPKLRKKDSKWWNTPISLMYSNASFGLTLAGTSTNWYNTPHTAYRRIYARANQRPILSKLYGKNGSKRKAKHKKIVNRTKSHLLKVFMGLKDIEFAHNDTHKCQNCQQDRAPNELVFLNYFKKGKR